MFFFSYITGYISKRNILLCARIHILYGSSPLFQFIASDNDCKLGRQLTGLFHLSLKASSLQVHIRYNAKTPQLFLDFKSFCDGIFTKSGNINSLLCFGGRNEILHFQSQKQSFQTNGKTNARCGRPADFFDQSVIPTATADCALGAKGRILNFKGRIGVVVKAPYQSGIYSIGNTKAVEVVLHCLKFPVAFITEIICNLRSTYRSSPAPFFLAVQNAQRILIKSFPAVIAELVLLSFEEFNKFLPVSRATVLIANGIQVKIQILQSELMEISQAMAMTSASAKGEDAPSTSRPN